MYTNISTIIRPGIIYRYGVDFFALMVFTRFLILQGVPVHPPIDYSYFAFPDTRLWASLATFCILAIASAGVISPFVRSEAAVRYSSQVVE